jgi:hypothetical protein
VSSSVRLGENSYKKVLGGAACLLLASAYLVHPGGGPVEQFGGARLVYGFDFEEIEDQGARSISERHALEEYRRIITERLDPTGARIGFATHLEGTLRSMVEDSAELAFYILNDFSRLGPSSDGAIEQHKFYEWLADNPDRPIREFNRLAPAEGGPAPGVHWYPLQAEEVIPEAIYMPVSIPSDEQFLFTDEDLDKVEVARDSVGYPAVGFSMKNSRRAAFGEFTSAHINEQMVIVLNDEVISSPFLNAAIYDDSIISGGFGTGFTQDVV